MDENDQSIKSPIKRLGSTRKLLVFNNIRLQLNEQLRCLDLRMEAQVALVTELQDFFRRRGELELDYSKNLEKLAKSLQLRHKEQKAKREQWPLFSSYACWQQLVAQTRNLSKDHVALAEVYSSHLVSRLGQVMEDVQRIYRRCREIGYETHEEILRVLHELHTTMKTYHSYQGECRQAEAKLHLAENQRAKLEQSLSQDKLERSKKYRMIEKEVSKRKNKYTDAKLKALKARNEYILCLEASNTTIHKYFVDDLSDLIDCMDFGFHNCISRALLMHVTAEEGRQRSVQNGLDTLSACINSLDSRLDKQRFLEFNHQAFMIPKKLEFQDQRNERNEFQPIETELHKILHQEMECRLNQLQKRVTTLRTESEEVWKTLETAESTLLEMLNAKDYDCSGYFGENALPASKPPETVSIKLRADRQETEEFYLSKFQEYLSATTRIARLDSKQEYLRKSLKSDINDSNKTFRSVSKTSRRKRIGRLQINGQPRLFGGSLEEYLELANQEIPLIIKSCIRVINLFGLHHQGIFRVSGSQVEINNFRESFERGEDPLADMSDASDINSVAGVLKLYLRELREPLFPIIYFDHFMELAQLESKNEFIIKIRELIMNLPRPVVVILRYLFAFLNHLSEFSDENMMDPYNLAICFGPTLVPVPDDKDQVQYQNLVNELIKNIIMFSDEIFPHDGGIVYEKYISQDPEDNDVGESPSDQAQDDMDSEICPSEDDSENMEAVAQFDFMARSDRELSLKKGDTVILYSQVSNDWWKGAVNGHEGLIPDKYISLKIKDDDKEKLDTFKSSSSEDSMKHQASSSSETKLPESSVPTSDSTQVQYVPLMWTSIIVTDAVTEPTVVTTDTSPLLSTKSRESSVFIYNEENHWDKINKKFKINQENSSIISHKTTINVNQSSLQNRKVNEPVFQKTFANTETDTKCSFTSRCRSHSPITEKGAVFLSSPTSKSLDSVELPIQVCDSELKIKEYIDKSNTDFSYNRELWQKRVNSQSNSEASTIKLTSHTKNWLKKHTPDLVMDLPLEDNINSRKSIKNSDVSSESFFSEVSSGEEDTVSLSSLECPLGLESPDMSTAAERFAKQNQCTLKKNTKLRTDVTTEIIGMHELSEKQSSETDAVCDTVSNSIQNNTNVTNSDNISIVNAEMSNLISKPQIKMKPQVSKKPLLTFLPPVSTKVLHKEKHESYLPI